MYKSPITNEQFFGLSAEYFGPEIFSGKATKRVSRMKRMWCAFAIYEGDMTYEEAGRFVHLHYSSVSYHKSKHNEEYFQNANYKMQYDNFLNFINSKLKSI